MKMIEIFGGEHEGHEEEPENRFAAPYLDPPPVVVDDARQR
jgi:hypothetical protein